MNWTRGRTIGFGSSAIVSLARPCDSGEVFAAKSATLSHSHSLQVEQQLLSTLSCPHIVSYKGCDVSTENGDVYYNLFLEYAPAGTLSDEVRRRGGSLSESAVKLYARQILLGMKYLHANGVVHCDIKGDNILITENGSAKLADFGCARRVEDYDHGLPSICGTPLYMAPEAARGEEQGFAADVWALGCTVMEMATGRPPWGDVSDPVSGLYRIGFSGDVPEIPSSLSKQGSDFVSKCLKRDAWERWSASELLGHPFLVEEGKPNCWNSPTTVLDQGLWDLEELDVVECGQRTYSKSAGERIRRLTEGNADKAATIFSGVVLLSWDCDEDWVTVRNTKEEVDHVDDDEATNTYSRASTSSNALLVLCNYCNASFCSRKMMCWPLEASTSNCGKHVFCLKPIFDNENFRFFNFTCLSMVYLLMSV